MEIGLTNPSFSLKRSSAIVNVISRRRFSTENRALDESPFRALSSPSSPGSSLSRVSVSVSGDQRHLGAESVKEGVVENLEESKAPAMGPRRGLSVLAATPWAAGVVDAGTWGLSSSSSSLGRILVTMGKRVQPEMTLSSPLSPLSPIPELKAKNLPCLQIELASNADDLPR